MAKIEDVLTKLVIETLQISHPERDPISFYVGNKTQTAITTAAKQIRQQQQERVKKLESILEAVPIQPDGEPIEVQGILSLSVAALRDEGHKSLASELEAVRDEQAAALKELEAT